MTDQSPEPVEPADAVIDETAVEPGTITNDLSEQDPSEVWIDDDQTPEVVPDYSDPVESVATVDGTLTIDSDGNLTADNALVLPQDGAQ